MDHSSEDESLLDIYMREIKRHTSLPEQELNRIEALMVQFATIAAMDSKILNALSGYNPKYAALAMPLDSTILDF